jgi:hypothetical protein
MTTKITYYAIVDDLSSREEPAGVLRRTEHDDGERDEAFTRSLGGSAARHCTHMSAATATPSSTRSPRTRPARSSSASAPPSPENSRNLCSITQRRRLPPRLAMTLLPRYHATDCSLKAML